MAENWTSKMGRVRDEISTMIDMGAHESDIEQHLKFEDVTPGQMRQYAAVNRAKAEPGAQPEASPWERFGRGAFDITEGVRQITGTQSNPEQVLADTQRYEQANPGFDGFRVAGQAAMTAPLALMPGAKEGLAARTAMGAGAGAMAGGSIYAKDPSERMWNTGAGLLGGGAFAAGAPAVASGVGSLLGRAKHIAGQGGRYVRGLLGLGQKFDDAMMNAGVDVSTLGQATRRKLESEARTMLQNTGEIDADALIRKARAEKFGFEGDTGMTRGQATRDPKVYSAEHNLRGQPGGEAIAERYNAQLAKIDDYMDNMRTSPDLQPDDVGEAIRIAAKAKADLMQKGVREVYEQVDKAMPGAQLSRDALAGRTAQILDDFEGPNGVSAGVVKRIQQLVDPESGRAFTPDELIKLDKLITTTMPGGALNPTQGTAAGKLKKAILGVLDDSAAAAPDLAPLYKAAKAKAAERFAAIGKPNKLLGQLVADSADTGKVVNKVMTGPLKEVRKLKAFVDDDWGVIQQGVENQIHFQATGKAGAFSQAAYNNAISKVGKRRLETIFGPEKAQELIDFGQVVRDLKKFPPMHTINTSNTAAEGAKIVRDVAGGLLDLVPGGRLMAPLVRGAQSQTVDPAMVRGLLNPLPGSPPMTNMAGPRTLGYLRAASPGVGLLGQQR